MHFEVLVCSVVLPIFYKLFCTSINSFLQGLGLIPDNHLCNYILIRMRKRRDNHLMAVFMEKMKDYGVKPNKRTIELLSATCTSIDSFKSLSVDMKVIILFIGSKSLDNKKNIVFVQCSGGR